VNSSKWSFNWFSAAQRQSFVISMSATVLMILLLALLGLIALIAYRGAAYFWPSEIYELHFNDSSKDQTLVFFAKTSEALLTDERSLVKIQYSDSQHPFGTSLIVERGSIVKAVLPTDVAEVRFLDGRVLFATLVAIETPEQGKRPVSERPLQEVSLLRQRINALHKQYVSPLHERLAELDRRGVSADAPMRLRLTQDFMYWTREIAALTSQQDSYRLYVKSAADVLYSVALAEVDRWHYPNRQSGWEKLRQTLYLLSEFLSDSPKQGNTSGGVFPALFGTILMVLLMTLMVTPVGVMTAIYLHEYAPSNWFTSALRIAVANMAGVPSIVYGVFGLGFFVYVLGGSIDELLFADKLPSPTMGSPGLFWASLTMAILTLPVVIVSTEEGLRRVPAMLRAGSYALGATKYETLRYTILPIASPGIMTGVILAIARAAGEVAPLMLVGAVKYAPALPIDTDFPYVHLDRQFMHLGVLIYDGAFHSQMDTKGSSLVFATCLLLLLVVCLLNVCSVLLRNLLRKRYLRGS